MRGRHPHRFARDGGRQVANALNARPFRITDKQFTDLTLWAENVAAGAEDAHKLRGEVLSYLNSLTQGEANVVLWDGFDHVYNLAKY